MTKKSKVKFTRNKKKAATTAATKTENRSLLQKLGALTLRGAGAGIGYAMGNPAGGYSAGAGISRYLGFGDYTVSQNSLVDKSSNSVPMMHSVGTSVTVRHKEYLGEISTSPNSKAFKSTAYPINPGVPQTFPWLSGIASAYTEYDFKGLVFHFQTTSGSYSSSGDVALGSVMMATKYRSTDPPFTNKLAMLNEFFSTSCKVSESVAHAVECAPNQTVMGSRYIRSSPADLVGDEKFYDMGEFNVATVGITGGNLIVGELWVTYEVVLRKPRLTPFSSVYTAHYIGNTCNATFPLGQTGLTKQYDSIGLTISQTNRQITFPSTIFGRFMIMCVYDNSTNVVTNGCTFLQGASSVDIFRGVGSINCGSTAGTSDNVFAQFVDIQNNGQLCTVQVNNFTTYIGPGLIDIYVFILAPDTV
ncbi:hypothetical protein 3 [Hubei tombus-like virus 31]|uniref:hypothetical protein 3 n=1 Tax=Hubei tombus-like virus 31 TaxID=1923279 RepID=UPI000909BE53|nr:hypothetical protein 3 [Hubei tombus-like virus 31]APG76511.1 hypothetical protein 3 [Hubei tombus-like virus 31]